MQRHEGYNNMEEMSFFTNIPVESDKKSLQIRGHKTAEQVNDEIVSREQPTVSKWVHFIFTIVLSRSLI